MNPYQSRYGYEPTLNNLILKVFKNQVINVTQDIAANDRYESINRLSRVGRKTKKVKTMSMSYTGDVKFALVATDHSGWILLNGRLKSSLTSSQQQKATSLGFGLNIPDATNAFPVQNNSPLGGLSSSNQKTIARENLPDVTLGGVTSAIPDHSHSCANAGAHTHDVRYRERNREAGTQALYDLGDVNDGVKIDAAKDAGDHTHTIGNAGAHSHTITTSSINGGVLQTQFDVTPFSISLNMFVYLGI